MKRWLKRTMTRLAPATTTALLSARSRRVVQAVARRQGCVAVNDKLIAAFGPVVQSGPFRGLRLGPMSRAEHLGPYLLGVYESELNAEWKRLLSRPYSQVVDVGAKFGYYAVGLAVRLPGTPVVAFDTDPWARRATRETAAANGVGTVRVEGYCTPGWWGHHLTGNALIVSDCEGFEGELFSDECPPLATATLVIETHDHVVPGTSDRLRARFAATHDGVGIPARPAAPPADLDLSFLSPPERALASDELRSAEQGWLVFTPRGAACGF